MRFAHIADTHIRNLKYHFEYREVFKQLYSSLRKEKVDYSPPENKLEEAVEEDEDAIEKSLLSAMEIPRLVQTPLGIFHYEDKLKPSEKFDCWIGYTNFDITQNISDLIECVDGVEALEVMSRYTFFLGVGKMFNFRDVRL